MTSKADTIILVTKYFNFLEGICMQSSKETFRNLLLIASEQGGYFTTQQALSVGYAYPEQVYHVAHGNWDHVQRSIYRFHDYPPADRDDLIVLTLMSMNRKGEPQAVVSHETALTIYNLSDANPSRIHLTVPPGFRRQMPSEVILHQAVLLPFDKEHRVGYDVTTPIRTLFDIATSFESWAFFEGAIFDALRQGIVRRSQIKSLAQQILLSSNDKETLSRLENVIKVVG